MFLREEQRVNHELCKYVIKEAHKFHLVLFGSPECADLWTDSGDVAQSDGARSSPAVACRTVTFSSLRLLSGTDG